MLTGVRRSHRCPAHPHSRSICPIAEVTGEVAGKNQCPLCRPCPCWPLPMLATTPLLPVEPPPTGDDLAGGAHPRRPSPPSSPSPCPHCSSSCPSSYATEPDPPVLAKLFKSSEPPCCPFVPCLLPQVVRDEAAILLPWLPSHLLLYLFAPSSSYKPPLLDLQAIMGARSTSPAKSPSPLFSQPLELVDLRPR